MTMQLRAGRLELELDERTGAVVRLTDRATGLVHLAENPDRLLFRLTVPRGAWTSRFVDNHHAAPAVVRQTAHETVLRWAELPAADGPSGLSVEVRLLPLPERGELRFVMVVENHGPDRVVDVTFPLLSGWTGLGGKGRDRLTLGGHQAVDPHRFPLNPGMTYAQVHQKARTDYPVGLYAPWADLSGPGGGLSYLHYMAQPQNGSFVEGNLAGYQPGLRLALGWRTPVIIQPGERWESAAIGWWPHDGDWHVTADRYHDWMQTWFVPPPADPARRTMIGFQNVFLRGFDGWPIRGLDTIPQLAADGRRYGVHDLCLWDELSMGNYERMDERDLLSYSAAERRVLRRGLAQARAEGTNVNALVNFRLLPGGTRRTARRMGEALRLLDGSPHTENYGLTHHAIGGWCRDRGPNCYISSSFDERYRARVRRWTRQYLKLGYTSMFYDQPFELQPDYGRLAAGQRPEDTYAAVLSLVAEVRRMVHANRPEGYLIGEFCEAFMAQHIDLWMSWYTEIEQALLAAYSVPQTMHSWVVDNHPAQASRAFALGMYLCLCTQGNEATLAAAPAFGEHVLRLANLRRRTAERTVYARFRDNRGLALHADGPIIACTFEGAAGPAVIAAALGEAGRATLAVDRQRFHAPGDPAAGQLHGLDGTTRPVTGDQLTLELAANDVAVWTL
jgi:hypothetical protein